MRVYALKCQKIKTMNVIPLCVPPFLFIKDLDNAV